MNKNNFVNVVGYQFERVHTGVIKWILDSQNNSVTITEKYDVLKKLVSFCGKTISFKSDEISSITCLPEYSFGRKRKIDLVIKINLTTGDSKYIVIEMKVDSIPYNSQLDGSFVDFMSDVTNDIDTCFMLFLFGTSQMCKATTSSCFTTCRLDDIINIFSNLQTVEKVYTDWIASLLEEKNRCENVMDLLDEVNSIDDSDFWISKGYRVKFPLFYYLYHHLKSTASNTLNEWEIYSGGNNPVMNWTPGWETSTYKDQAIEYYWEFNYQSLVLKSKVDKDSFPKQMLTEIRTKIQLICDNSSIYSGYRTQNRFGHITRYINGHLISNINHLMTL